MIELIHCQINYPQETYSIEFVSNFLDHFSNFQNTFPTDCPIAIISDDITGSLYGHKLLQNLLHFNSKVTILDFPHGEKNKTRQTKERLENQLFDLHYGRDSLIIALGGGIVTDIAGFIAATYCRGISCFLIPTTLIAMVDAAIGGKTAINIPQGKNLLGSIYQPKKVLIDPFFLDTLPKTEILNGLVEMFKHSLITDSEYYFFLHYHLPSLVQIDKAIIKEAIYKSCMIKKNIIENDVYEKNKRRLLNFGHTIGHALEKLTGYEMSHGKAVAIGILVEIYISLLLKICKPSLLEKARDFFTKSDMDLSLPKRFTFEELFEAMILDKKSINAKPRFVILKEVGQPLQFDGSYCVTVENGILKEAIDWMNHALYCH